MSRPEYVHCIRQTHVERTRLSWCGEPIDGFAFESIDHAAYNGAAQGRLVACANCVRAVREALTAGSEEGTL